MRIIAPLAAMAFLAIAAGVRAQAIAPVPPRIASLPGQMVRELDRLAALVRHEAWDDLGELADRLVAQPVDGWVRKADRQYIGLREAVHRLIAELPPAGLAAYRRRIDLVARDWLEAGRDQRDEALLQKVVDQAFCSAAGDDALWSLGEISLERGDCQAARAAWQRIYPETAAAGQLAYPDSTIPLAAVRARLALASIRAGDLERAAREISVLRQHHPTDRGPLGGADVVLVDFLDALLAEARQEPPAADPLLDWPTLFGNAQRTGSVGATIPADAQYELAWEAPVARLAGFPVIAGGNVLYQDGGAIHIASLQHGPAERAEGPATLAVVADSDDGASAILSVDRDRVAAVLTAAAAHAGALRAPAPSRVMVFDMDRDGALLMQQQPAEPSARFLGPAVFDGSRVILLEASTGPSAMLRIVAFDVYSGQPRWQRSLGWDMAADRSEAPAPASLAPALAADDGVVFVSSEIGLIAAVRAVDGEPLWLHTYDRAPADDAHAAFSGVPAPCRVAQSTIVAAPADRRSILALDAASGGPLWTAPRPVGARLLAVDDARALLGGARLGAIDLRSGQLQSEWGGEVVEEQGQGVVAGDVLFWPTALEIVVVNRATGAPTGAAIPLSTPGGAVLAVAKPAAGTTQYLLAAGRNRLAAYRIISTPGPPPAAGPSN